LSAVEQAITFDCAGETLVGVLSRPPAGARCSDLGVVIVVGGPQFRVGSHRQFVRLARLLAADGHAVLRFDVRGMGDSSGRPSGFEGLDDDLEAALQVLRRTVPEVRRVVLWGLCDGASAALMLCARRRPADVAGLCLVNPWLRSGESRARTQFRVYYRERLLQPEFWRKLVSGGVALGALREFGANLKTGFGRRAGAHRTGESSFVDFRHLMAQGWRRFDGAILLVLCGNDFTAREFLDGCATLPDWQGLVERRGVTRLDVPEADHTFSTSAARQVVEDGVRGWLRTLPSAQR
jgi:exosortase A-associated hydrolase 1